MSTTFRPDINAPSCAFTQTKPSNSFSALPLPVPPPAPSESPPPASTSGFPALSVPANPNLYTPSGVPSLPGNFRSVISTSSVLPSSAPSHSSRTASPGTGITSSQHFPPGTSEKAVRISILPGSRLASLTLRETAITGTPSPYCPESLPKYTMPLSASIPAGLPMGRFILACATGQTISRTIREPKLQLCSSACSVRAVPSVFSLMPAPDGSGSLAGSSPDTSAPVIPSSTADRKTSLTTSAFPALSRPKAPNCTARSSSTRKVPSPHASAAPFSILMSLYCPGSTVISASAHLSLTRSDTSISPPK